MVFQTGETKYHFTESNSPLSNVINNIDINSTTGEVYIATAKLVSFKGMATQANDDDLANVYAYP
jgi:hypothetical protein